MKLRNPPFFDGDKGPKKSTVSVFSRLSFGDSTSTASSSQKSKASSKFRRLSRSRLSCTSNLGSQAVLKFVERHQDGPQSEYHELCNAFKIIDLNGDGKISTFELGVVLRSLGDTIPEEELLLMVGAVNGERGGHICLPDFIDINSSCEGEERSDATHMKELMAAFQLLDLDKNNFISAQEIYQVLEALGESLTMDECCLMVKSVDSDGDDQINFEEFVTMMSNTSAAPACALP